MTIGELYIRQGETFSGHRYFGTPRADFCRRWFSHQGDRRYKRIAKLAPEEIRRSSASPISIVQQGVMSEARPLFLQLAEIHLKNNRQPEAVSLLKKASPG